MRDKRRRHASGNGTGGGADRECRKCDLASQTPPVFDTNVLQEFALTGRFDILARMFGVVWVPEAVIGELEGGHERSMSRASEGDAAAGTRCEGFRRLLSLRDDCRLRVLELTPAQVQVYARLGDKDWREARGIPALDSGERACLAVAMDSGCAVATNDKAASKAALRLTGRPVLTSLDILQQAAERGYIRDEEIAGLIQRMAHTHQHSGTTRSGI